MNTVTNYDIRDHVILPTIGNEFDDETLDRILAAVLEVAPVSTWRLRNLQYVSDQMDEDTYWAIVEREGTR
mgnify:CR=1 FL=1